MILHSIRLLSFRAHEQTSVTFAPKVNLIHGPNGAGKTNILEAIHFLCLSKSFIVSQDSYVLRTGAPYFEIEGLFEGTRRPELRVRLVYMPDQGKSILINKAPAERLSQVVGMLPVVVFSPEDHALTAGGPDQRRRFVNNVLSQARPVYLDDVLKYGRALKQRNELLTQQRRRGASPGFKTQLESWNEELIALGSRVISARLRFISTFAGFLERAHQKIGELVERPTAEYVTIAAIPAEPEESDIERLFREKLHRAGRREVEIGRTLVGPHLDEIIFRLNDFEVRRYASQGQHRTFGMALKLAQYFYLQDRLDEKPILLLDDVFGSLDPGRIQSFLELLQTDDVGQTIMTATQPSPFDVLVPFDEPSHASIRVVSGHTEGAP